VSLPRRQDRYSIDEAGRLEIVDPDFGDLALMRALDPGFRIQRSPMPCAGSPRFLSARRAGTGLALRKLPGHSEEALWEVHTATLAHWHAGGAPQAQAGEAGLLDLKAELAVRLSSPCRLCPRRCGALRESGQAGQCGLAKEAMLAEAFVHIAEEPQITPSLVLSLAGCGLRCRFCQQHGLLDPWGVRGRALSIMDWAELDLRGARTLSFAGGNPDESLPEILRFLLRAPEGLTLPVVWNANGHAAPQVVSLLEGVVDIYLLDFKFGEPGCAEGLASAPGYPEQARRTVAACLSQGVPVIVRLLLLPGHVKCCHLPALEMLWAMNAPQLLLSLRNQYRPAGNMLQTEGTMSQRVRRDEAEEVLQRARTLGLHLVEDPSLSRNNAQDT